MTRYLGSVDSDKTKVLTINTLRYTVKMVMALFRSVKLVAWYPVGINIPCETRNATTTTTRTARAPNN